MRIILALTGPAFGWTVASSHGGPDIALLLNYGVLGVVTLLWLTGRIETPKRADAAEARAAAAEAREREMEHVLRTEVVPAMAKFTDVGTRILERSERR